MASRQPSRAVVEGTQASDGNVLARLRRRHDRGLYSVASDIEASAHYQDRETGLRMGLRRMRCYVRGFCS